VTELPKPGVKGNCPYTGKETRFLELDAEINQRAKFDEHYQDKDGYFRLLDPNVQYAKELSLSANV
jgi:hypothetical protein